MTNFVPDQLLINHQLFVSQQIMKDQWMNVGYEDKELESYKEPEQDFNDLKRIGQTDTHTYMQTHKNTYTQNH